MRSEPATLIASASRWLLARVSSAMALVKTDSTIIEKKARARLPETGRFTVTNGFLNKIDLPQVHCEK
jgi:hypothetical protein